MCVICEEYEDISVMQDSAVAKSNMLYQTISSYIRYKNVPLLYSGWLDGPNHWKIY